MSQAFIVSFGIEAMRMAVLLSAPMLGGALLIGLLISIFQAVTQIQEQTLAIIPKMAAIVVIIIFLASWLLSQASTYMSSIFVNFHRFIDFG